MSEKLRIFVWTTWKRSNLSMLRTKDSNLVMLSSSGNSNTNNDGAYYSGSRGWLRTTYSGPNYNSIILFFSKLHFHRFHHGERWYYWKLSSLLRYLSRFWLNMAGYIHELLYRHACNLWIRAGPINRNAYTTIQDCSLWSNNEKT